jgi:hypothetical protein
MLSVRAGASGWNGRAVEPRGGFAWAGKVMDEESFHTVSGVATMAAYLGFFGLMAETTWVDTVDQLADLIPPQRVLALGGTSHPHGALNAVSPMLRIPGGVPLVTRIVEIPAGGFPWECIAVAAFRPGRIESPYPDIPASSRHEPGAR